MSSVDDALDRLESIALREGWIREDVATVREALERLREERDALGLLASQRRDEVRGAEYARERMAYERNEARDTANFHAEKRQAAEAEVQRLTEGLREIAELTDDELTKEKARALLAGSEAEPTFAGIPIVVDPTTPPGRIELRGPAGEPDEGGEA